MFSPVRIQYGAYCRSGILYSFPSTHREETGVMRRVSRITTIALACAIGAPLTIMAVSPVASANVAAKHAARVTTTLHGTRGFAHRIGSGAFRPAAAVRLADPLTNPLSVPMIQDGYDITGPVPPSSPAMRLAPAASGAVAAPSRSLTTDPSVAASFNGLSMHDSVKLNGHTGTPPDQGLCAGRDPSLPGNPMAIWETVNIAAREIAPDGTLLRPDQPLKTLFNSPFADGDVRCIWDPATQSFIFSELAFPAATGPGPLLENTTVDITVLNKSGTASYQFDTSLGGQCLGDQPTLGFNIDSVIVSVNEFCGPHQFFTQAEVYVFSLRQLVALDATIGESSIGPLTLPGNFVLSVDPVYGPGLATAYLVNSFLFDANGNVNHAANTLGFWTLTNTFSVTRGTGAPVLTGTIIPSETYGFPIRAASTGTGQVVAVINGRKILSEALLNPNDSRIN